MSRIFQNSLQFSEDPFRSFHITWNNGITEPGVSDRTSSGFFSLSRQDLCSVSRKTFNCETPCI